MKLTRSISTDLFFSKQREKQQNRHLKKIEQIKTKKEEVRKIAKQTKKIQDSMKKARDQARIFKSKQDRYHHGQKDEKMLKNMQSMRSKLKFNPQKLQILKKTNKINPLQLYYRQKANQKLAKFLQQDNKLNVKKVKQKIAQQTEDYIKLRQHMQRFKTNRQNNMLSKSINSKSSNSKLSKITKNSKRKKLFQTEGVLQQSSDQLQVLVKTLDRGYIQA